MFLFKSDDEPKGTFINLFCNSSNIPYTVFYDWFKKTQKKIIPLELVQVTNEQQDVTEDKFKRTSPYEGSIMVTIRAHEGLYIQKKGLDY